MTRNNAEVLTMPEPLPLEQMHINGLDTQTVLGGVEQSGNGPNKVLHALNKYTILKTAGMQL